MIATKFGHRFHPERMQSGWSSDLRSEAWSPQEVVEQLEGSLRALRTDYVDVYQAHGGSDADLANEELWEALADQVRAGKIRQLGISLGPPDDVAQVELAARVGASTIQVTSSRLTRAAEEVGRAAQVP